MSITTDHLADVPHPARSTSPNGTQVCLTQAATTAAQRASFDRVEDPHGDDIRVEIYSSQSVAGDVTRLIAFDEGNYERTHLTIAAHAREFGQALIAAADRSTRLPATIRRWTDDDRD